MVRAKKQTEKPAAGARLRSARSGLRPKAYHHGDLPRALVGAAVDLITARGPEAFTLREVAGAVGVTHGAAYRHFEDKTALLAAVAEDGYRALTIRLKEVLRADPPPGGRARIRALAVGYVGFAVERPAHYRVMWGPRLNEDGRFPTLEAAIEEAFEVVRTEMALGQESGVFRAEPPARELAIGMWVTAHGYVELVARRRLKVKSPKVAVEYFSTLLEPFLDGLAHPGS
jgi:AcrR family transcriptional regulator